MHKLKIFVKNNLKDFFYFYHYLGYRIFISLSLSFGVGFLDGLGLAMFLPLLKMVDNNNASVGSEQMGNLSFLIDGLRDLNISINLQNILLVMLFFFVLKGIMKFFAFYYNVILQQFFIKTIRFSNIDLLAGLKYKAFIKNDSGRIQNTFSGEVDKVLQAYKAYFTTLQNGIMVLVYIFLAFTVNAQFAVLVAIGGALTNLIFKRLYKVSKGLSRKLTKEGHGFQGLLIQNVANFKYLKATGLIYNFGEKLKKRILAIERIQLKLGTIGSFLASVREPIVVLVVVAVILVQVNVFSQSLGLIILSLLFFYRALTYLMAVQTFWNRFLSVSGSLENMTEFTDEMLLDQERNTGDIFHSFSRSLVLENVSFSYDSTTVLDNISLKINKNETIAFVGHSGSGKTTLINIISGLLQTEDGKFYIDGKDTKNINIASFQKRIGYITQEPALFNDTIFNNITFWDEPTSINLLKFEKAIKLASIYDFVMRLPEKYNSPLGSNGVMVSGGQKQRISIARELYKEVDILLMDEATSALDSETERIIQKQIEKLKGQFTIIIIAHRLSTIKNADKIVFLKDGKLQMAGDFESLKEKSSEFKRLVEFQTF